MNDQTSISRNFPTLRRALAPLTKLSPHHWWRRNRRRTIILAAALVISWLGLYLWSSVVLNRELNAIKQRGEPLTLAQLNPRIADADNALLLYSRAYAQLKYEGDENWLMQGISKDASGKTSESEIKDARQRIFERNRNVTTLLFQAVQKPHFQLPPEPLQETKKKSIFDMNERQKLLSHQREFARFMGAQAEYEAKRGNTKAALRCITTIYRMSDQIAQEPNLIAMLVAIAIEHIGHEWHARVLDIAPLSLTQAQNAAAQLPRGNLDQAYRRALQHERVFLSQYFGDSRYWWKIVSDSQDASSATWIDRFFFALFAPQRKLDGAAFMRLDLSKPTPQIPWYAIMTRVMSPSYEKSKLSIGRAQDTREMARIALALKLWKQTHDSYLKSLNELSSIPIASLRNALKRRTVGYKSQGDKFLLYSFGMNRRDDGGKFRRFDPINPKVVLPNDNSDDLAWRQSLGVKKRNN